MKVKDLIQNIKDLQGSRIAAEDMKLITAELEKLLHLEDRANQISLVTGEDIDTAWDLAKAEVLIRENGFYVDLADILSMEGDTDEFRKELSQGVVREYIKPRKD